VNAVLVREDPALRHIGKWFAMSLVSAALVVNVILLRMAGGESSVPAATVRQLFALVAWMLLVGYVGFGDVRTRCSRFGMSLPLPAGDLWRAHVIAVAVGAGLVLLAGAMAEVVLITAATRLSERVSCSLGDVFAPLLHVAAVAMLAIAVLESRAPALRTVPFDRTGIVVTVVVMLAALPAALLTANLPLVAALVPLGAAALLWRRQYRSVPPVFSMAPERAPHATAPVSATDGWAPRPRSAFSLWWLTEVTVARLIYKKPVAPFIAVPFILFIGAILAGMDQYWVEDRLRPLTIVMASYVMMALAIEPMMHVHRVDPYPISRRRVFALLVAVPLLALAVGYGAGTVAVAGFAPAHALNRTVDFREADDGTFRVFVPIEYCRLHWGDDVPECTAPWGETAPAWSTPVVRGLPLHMYSPYSVGAEASVDFAALQISRAAEAIYGEPITPDEIERRYLRARADGSPALATEALTLEQDFPALKRRPLGPVFPIVFMLVALIWLLALRAYLPLFRAGRSHRLLKGMGFVFMGAVFSLYILELVLDARDIMPLWVAGGAIEALARQMGDAFTGSAVLVWVGCLGLTALAYLGVERRFAGIESLPSGSRSCAD
jgi:hypothetical protein